MSEKLTIRPYARLLTMLGDQLIKNEKIALIELIKNSYDADASWVKVSFYNFGDGYLVTPQSKIVIEDDGNGMNRDIIINHWLNPATPIKSDQKKTNSHTQKGRIIQGEKGIGRFSVFKLGKTIKVVTRRQTQSSDGSFSDGGEKEEYTLRYDYSQYDSDFLSTDDTERSLLLDELPVSLECDSPLVIVKKEVKIGLKTKQRAPHGTIIEISDLKTKWSEDRINEVLNEVGKMQPIFSAEDNSDFDVCFYRDTDMVVSQESYKSKLRALIDEKAVFKITNGKYDDKTQIVTFDLNGRGIKLPIDDIEFSGQKRKYKHIEDLRKHDERIECGSFDFEFYIFDFISNLDEQTKYNLDKEEKSILKSHRIYLYRDGVRVMPYGDPSDDWLKIDLERGTVRASEYPSNDQTVGCVYISQESNPKLKDKTNREGLIEDGHAFEDFVCILQLVLGYIRKKPFAQYLIEKQRKAEVDFVKKGRPAELISQAKEKYFDNTQIKSFLEMFESSYSKERRILDERIYRTENLAAVGLSVETATHDVSILIKRATENMTALIRDCENEFESIKKDDLVNKLSMILGNISMVGSQFEDIQQLFPSTKLKTKNIRVNEIVEKINNIYSHQLTKNEISVDIVSTKTPLVVKTTDAVLLQVFINLFDNSLYWLKNYNGNIKRNIRIELDGNNNKAIFSDNGPGIKDDDKDYIFDAFYSGKGEEGKGLGLYIARQLLDRYDYSINLAEFSSDKKLEGANFVLEFVKGD